MALAHSAPVASRQTENTKTGNHIKNMNTMKTEWQASDQSKAEYMGTLEVEDRNGEFHNFEVLLVPGERYIFGGACNAGFLESGYMKLENESGELGELLAELECYYNDGPDYAPRLVCNDRM